MLNPDQAEALGRQLENLQCTDPNAGDGLFLFAFKGEPKEQAAKYEAHFPHCEYCRVALEAYRYQREVAKVLGRKLVGEE